MDMKRILIAYSTNAGSTEEVAREIGKCLERQDVTVDVRNIRSGITDLSGYDAAVIGGPMIFGWHRKTRSFCKKYRNELAGIPTALFFTSMQVVMGGGNGGSDIPLFIDPKTVVEPAIPEKLSFKEKHTTLERYLKPIRGIVNKIAPVGMAFFTGKLDYRALKLPQMLFVMLFIQAKPGDYRNRDLIREWAESLQSSLTG